MLILTLSLLYLFDWFQMRCPSSNCHKGCCPSSNYHKWCPLGKGWTQIFYKVDGCDASYIAKYNLIQRSHAHHNVTMEAGKLAECPSIWVQGLKVQDHTIMNVQVLRNFLAQFYCNEPKVIARARRHITLEWDRLKGDLQYTLEVFKPTLVKLISNHNLQLLGMTTWGVGPCLSMCTSSQSAMRTLHL